MISEKERFLGIVEENKGIIYKIANSYCRDSDDRKDVVQEIIIQLWRSFDTYNDRYKISTWMYRVSLNVAISCYRKEKRNKYDSIEMTPSILNLPDEPQDSETEIALLWQCIAELKALDRAIIILYLDTKTYSEIAEIMDISETNVATRISRIKEKLKLKLLSLNA